MTTPKEDSAPPLFLRARFAGGRFDTHTLPLDLLPDLASYRRLIVEVARHLFKTTHGDRIRVPKGFEQSFQLAIASVQGGNSSTAELVEPVFAPRATQAQLFTKHPEFEQAREFVADLIRRVARGERVPESFPPALVGLFNPFGQNLQGDEFLELESPASGVVRYTDGVRRAIVLSAEQLIESSVDGEFILNGGVSDTGTIHVRDSNGRSLDFQPASQFEFDEAYRRAKGRVRLAGSGLYDETGALRRLLAVSAHFERPAFHLEIRSSFDDIRRSLTSDGTDRVSRLQSSLQSLQEHIESYSDSNLDLGRPYVYVLEAGEISVEWSKDTWEANIEISSSGAEYTIHALDTATKRTIWSKVNVGDRSAIGKGLSSFFATLAPESREA